MPDLLVKLYELPAPHLAVESLRETGIEIRRALPAEKSAVTAWVEQNFSSAWADECAISFCREPISCHIATEGNMILGFGCYGIMCPDFYGPLGVSESHRRRNIGLALLLTGLQALQERGFAYAIIGWAGPVEYFQRHVGAVVIDNSEPGAYRGLLTRQTS